MNNAQLIDDRQFEDELVENIVSGHPRPFTAALDAKIIRDILAAARANEVKTNED